MDVERIQRALLRAGFDPGPIDGLRGPKTDAAIVAFKASHGLRQRPYVGPLTLGLLFGEEEDQSLIAGDAAIPPLAMPLLRRLGYHEHHHHAQLMEWFRNFGLVLGSPRRFPWCGEGVENAALEMFPDVAVPKNPFWAENWQHYGVDAGGAVVGSVGVIDWYRGGGHVGIVARHNPVTDIVTLLGCNQSDRIQFSDFKMKTSRGRFIAFRVPPCEAGKTYPPLNNRSAAGGGYAGTR